jgi:hypothetical protein
MVDRKLVVHVEIEIEDEVLWGATMREVDPQRSIRSASERLFPGNLSALTIRRSNSYGGEMLKGLWSGVVPKKMY